MQAKRYWRWCQVLGLGLVLQAAGCGWFWAPPAGQSWQSTEVEVGRAAITDPKLRTVAESWQAWVLQQTAQPKASPLFGRVELLPVTVTTLPYGIGANEQQPRLPVIVMTGAGWTKLEPKQKEQEIARAYRDLSDRLQKAGFGEEYRPTLTLQTPQGMVLAWVNDLKNAGRLIHGDND